MADFPSIKPDSENIALRSANQIYDSPLTNSRQVGTLAPARWEFTASFNNRYGTEARQLKSFLFGLNGSATPFNYYPAHIEQLGTMQGNGVIDGADQTGTTISTKGWEYGQPLLFATGDYLTVNGELKMVTGDVDGATGSTYIEYSGTNYMPSPFDPSGWANGAATDITNVSTQNPSGESFAGLVDQVLSGGQADSINDSEYVGAVSIGDSFAISVIAKAVSGDASFRLRFNDDIGFLGSVNINIATGQRFSGGGGDINQIWDVSDLSDGFKLFQTMITAYRSASSMSGQIIYEDGTTQITPPPQGTKIYVQAAYFGKNTDWPAFVGTKIDIPITPALRKSPSDGAAIATENPYSVVTLENDDQAQMQVSSPVIYASSFNMLEFF